MKIYKRISCGLPLTVEWEESSGLVYVRNNIEPSFEDENGQFYSYDEMVCTVKEYINIHFSQMRADLDYLSMMAEVDL